MEDLMGPTCPCPCPILLCSSFFFITFVTDDEATLSISGKSCEEEDNHSIIHLVRPRTFLSLFLICFIDGWDLLSFPFFISGLITNSNGAEGMGGRE